MLELALQSAQCMARGLSKQVETLQQNCHEKEAALQVAKGEANKCEDEARRLEQRAKELEQTLGICKRRIVEQNENNTHLLEKVHFYSEILIIRSHLSEILIINHLSTCRISPCKEPQNNVGEVSQS